MKKETKKRKKLSGLNKESSGLLIYAAAIIAGILLSISGYSLISENVTQHSSAFNRPGELVPSGIEDIPSTDGVEVVPTMLDNISSDSAWCPTFELVWQDMKNEVVFGDVIFSPQLTIVENLNKSYFTENDLSSEYYYKKWGLKTLELKSEIEKGIMDKFNQKSDILDKIDWSDAALNDPNNSNVDRYLFYTMLYREFEFEYEFDKLDNAKFKDVEDIQYFGIETRTDNKVRRNINVLFYQDEDNYAVSINTKNNDEIILYKNPNGSTFKDIYDELNNKINNNTSSSIFKDVDTFKMPYLKFNVLKEYEELEGKPFPTYDGGEAEIEKALQSIQFEIDNKGGKVKSEAAIDMMKTTSAAEPHYDEPRHFDFDDTFVLFLKEKDKSLPYLAVRIDDIKKYQ